MTKQMRRSLAGLAILITVLAFSTGSSFAFLQTLSDFLSLGANTVREVQDAISLAGDEVAETLNVIEGTILDLMDELESKYQDNLNITIDSLDNATRNKLLELESLLFTVNDILKEDVRFLTAEARALLDDTALEIRQLTGDIKDDLQDMVIVVGETGAFLIDKGTENFIIGASVLFLAIGTLMFVWLLFRSSSNLKGFAAVLAYGLVLAYLGFFTAMLFAPQVRAYVMTSTGLGLQERLNTVIRQPDIFAVRPSEIIAGETTELDIWGSNLLPDGEEPTITIANRSFPFVAADDHIVVDISSLMVAAQSAGISETILNATVNDTIANVGNLAIDAVLETQTTPVANDTIINMANSDAIANAGNLVVTGVPDVMATPFVVQPANEVFSVLTNPTLNQELLQDLVIATPAIDSPTGNAGPIIGSRVIVDRNILEIAGLDVQETQLVGEMVVNPNIDWGRLLGMLPEGVAVVKLDYENFDDLTALVRVTAPEVPLTPPDLRVTSFTLSPSTATAGNNVQASITIQNSGEEDARNFNLVWRPTGNTANNQVRNISRLAGGATQTFTLTFAYPNAGTFNSVAELDTLNRVTESNEGNNSRSRNITVNEPPPRRAEVTIQFTSITVHSDADPGIKGEGEWVFNFNINGQTQRYPNSGDRGFDSGDSRSFTRTFTMTLAEGENLSLFVNGIEKDSPDSDDQGGTVTRAFTSGQNWGAGSHNTRSTCPDGCYTVFYTISVRNLP